MGVGVGVGVGVDCCSDITNIQTCIQLVGSIFLCEWVWVGVGVGVCVFARTHTRFTAPPGV